MMPQHICEDLTDGLDVVYGGCRIKTAQNEERYVELTPVLEDGREDGHFRFRRGEKTDALMAIVALRVARGERGVIFVRTVTLLTALKAILAPLGAPMFELTGEKSDNERWVAINRFRSSPNGLLIMTRTTGGRGLDLPFASYCIFYSPKSEPATMWQEMSRIRSTMSKRKDIYVLCYGEEEAATLTGVLHALLNEGRRVSHQRVYVDEISAAIGDRAPNNVTKGKRQRRVR
jgi:superfamily II DNA/RNA helicase